jgi:hypothetical protein
VIYTLVVGVCEETIKMRMKDMCIMVVVIAAAGAACDGKQLSMLSDA